MLAGGDSIVSTGGGSWMREMNRQRIAQHGISVWLDCDLETLWHRVRNRPTRPPVSYTHLTLPTILLV